MTTYLDAYKEGLRAFRKGLLISDSPYDEATELGQAWFDGWHSGAKVKFNL